MKTSNKEFVGTLRGFDDYVNVVLDDVTEYEGEYYQRSNAIRVPPLPGRSPLQSLQRENERPLSLTPCSSMEMELPCSFQALRRRTHTWGQSLLQLRLLAPNLAQSCYKGCIDALFITMVSKLVAPRLLVPDVP